MSETERERQENEARRARISRLSESSLRTALSLDLVTVLEEVVDNARLLTNARYGALAVFDAAGHLQRFITSGITPEERQRIAGEGPLGLGLFGYVNRRREPLRLANLHEHPESVGFPENHPPMKTFLGIPILHLGENFGNLYLTEKDAGQEFTAEDEEILVMFASHAAVVIANARRYSHEHQARADLEALISSSPVGVLVVDAETRTVLSVNFEAERIIGVLPEPGVTLEQYREAITCTPPSGSLVATEELPLERALGKGETPCAPNSSSSIMRTGRRSPPWSTPRRFTRKTDGSCPLQPSSRTSPPWRIWKGCAPSSSPRSARSCECR